MALDFLPFDKSLFTPPPAYDFLGFEAAADILSFEKEPGLLALLGADLFPILFTIGLRVDTWVAFLPNFDNFLDTCFVFDFVM